METVKSKSMRNHSNKMSVENRKAENKSNQIVVKNNFGLLAKFKAGDEVDKKGRLISTKVGDIRPIIAQGYNKIQNFKKRS